jgi:uncharacterized membrane protein
MWLLESRGWRLSRGGALFLFGLGCDDTVVLGHGDAAKDGQGGQAGAGSGSSSAGAAGAPASQDNAGYRFYLVPPLGPPLQASEPDDVLTTRVDASSISKDGSLIVGTSSYQVYRGFDVVQERRDDIFWTRETGTQRFEKRSLGACLTPDGSAVFGNAAEPDGANEFFRWTREGEFQTLNAKALFNGSFDDCSADGKTATGAAASSPDMLQQAMIWQRGKNADEIITIVIPSLADAHQDRARLSRDGSTVVIQSRGSVERSASIHRWTAASGVTSLGLPTGYVSCELKGSSRGMVVNADASAILADCLRAAGEYPTLFRWTLAAKAWAALPQDAPREPVWMSEDGLTLIGHTLNEVGPKFVYWTEGTPPFVDLNPTGTSEAAAVSDDGGAYVNFHIYSPLERQFAVRWQEGVLTPLPRLPGHAQSGVNASSADGRLAVGGSWEAGGEGRAVLWDDQGVRDITAELEAAGVDLQGVDELMADRVWSGSPIVIQGHNSIQPDDPTTSYHVWFAELPARD